MTRVLRRFLTVLVVATVAGLLPRPIEAQRIGPGGAPPAGSGDFNVPFARVINGDTLDTWVNGHRVAVGLIGVTAPMGNTSCGQEATDQLKALVKGGLKLEEDTAETFDAAGRRMYQVKDKQGTLLADSLVRKGVARANGRGRDRSALAGAENEARAAARGCAWGGRRAAEGPSTGADGEQVADAVPLGADAAASGGRLSKMSAPVRAAEAAARAGDLAATTTSAMQAGSGVTVPPGFVDEVVMNGVVSPTGFAFLPDGRILFTEHQGRVRIYKNGSLLATPVIDIRSKVNQYYDRGLIGLAVDPNFATNGYVYLYYVYENNAAQFDGPKTARLTRITMVGDTAAPSSEVVILGTSVGAGCNDFPAGADCIPADSFSHNGGGLKFGADGSLYVSIGDASNFNMVTEESLRAQNLDSLSGKVLRISPTGQGLPDNPFWTGSASANRSKVWAYGLRNPFRMSLKPGSDVPFMGDVGWNTWEEINVASKGANLGWPCYEGQFRQSGFETYDVCQALYQQNPPNLKTPLTSYSTQPGGGAIMGGPFYTGTGFPGKYQGTYFYADYVRGIISNLAVDANNALVSGPEMFATGIIGGLVDFQLGPDGNLYYITLQSFSADTSVRSELHRIRYADGPDTIAPTVLSTVPADAATGVAAGAALTATFSESMAPTSLTTSTVTLVKTGSPEQPIAVTLSYDDTLKKLTITPTTSLVVGATYRVTIKGGAGGATDANHVPLVADKVWTFTTSATANSAPTATITAPGPNVRWKVGDVIPFSGTGSDAEDGALPGSALTWDILLHHCIGGACHIHPMMTAAGAAGSFTVPDHGDESYFEVKLTATDSGYLTGSASRNVDPTTVEITLDTVPSGLNVVYDGTLGVSPMTRTTIVGSSHTLTAPSPQEGYGFVSWSDGGAAQHTVTLGTQNATFTATYGTARSAAYTSTPPTSWQAGQTQTYSVTVQNTGVETWKATGNNPVHLGIHFGDASDACCTWATDQRFDLPNDVPPGGSATLSVAVTAPSTAGPYVLRHRMLEEHVAWFDQIQKTDVTVSASSTQPLAASYTSTPPTTWQPGVPQTYAVTVKNTGTQTWNKEDPNAVHLGVHFGDASDACCTWATDQRYILPNDVAPGASVTLNVQVTPPVTGGAYVLRHRMVKEHVAWFDQIQKTDVTVGGSATATATPTSTSTSTSTATATAVPTGTSTATPTKTATATPVPSATATATATPTSTSTTTPVPTATATGTGTAIPAALSAEYTSTPPTGWLPGQTQTYAIAVKNTGSETWLANGATRVRLGIHFGGASDACCSWATDQRFSIPHDMPPGASHTFTVNVTAPAATGPYVLRHRMLKEQVAWFSQIHKTSVTVGGLAASYSTSPPTSWQPGVPQTYSVTLTNTGTQTWNKEDPNAVHLGVHFGGASDACCTWATDQRYILPNDVAPGASVTLNVQVTPPVTGGAYVLRHRMVKEHIAWFDQIQRTNVTVGAGASTPTATATPTSTPTATPGATATATPIPTATPLPTATATTAPLVLAASYSGSPPVNWISGQTQAYAVSVTNTGTETWLAGGVNQVRLGVHFGGASDACCSWATDQRFSIPHDMPPGASHTFTINVTAPTTGGPYVLRHRMVKEQVAWFSQIHKSNVTVGGLAASYSSSPPTSWQAGVPQIYAVAVTNTGTLPWNRDEPNAVHLAAQFGDASDHCCNAVTDQRFVLPNDVPPGGTVTLTIQVTPPNTTGSFTLRHRVVKEYIAWVDQIQKTAVSVSAAGFSGQRPAAAPASGAHLAPVVSSSPTPGRTRADRPER